MAFEIAWDTKQLGECLSTIIDHRGKTPKKLGSDWVGQGIPTISAKNVNGGKLVARDAIRCVSESIYKKWMNSGDVERGDCFLVSEGATLGECMYWDEDYPIVLGQRLFCLRANPKILYPRYLYFYMTSHAFQSEVVARSTGTSVPGLRQTEVLKLQIRLPSIEVQRMIGDTFYNLNAKIELNRRMNETLEGIARALFKSWFVDFDPVRAKMDGRQPAGMSPEIANLFPSEFEHVNGELVPKGWTIEPLSRLATLRTQSVTPGSEPRKTWEHYSIPAYDDRRQPGLELGATIKSNKYVVPHNSILVSKLNPQFPRVWLPDICDRDAAISSTEFMPFVPNRTSWRSFLYETAWSEFFQNEIQMRVTGSTGSRQRVKPKEVAEMPLLKPADSLIDAFGTVAEPLHAEQLTNIRLSNSLAALRDTLLPKLLSGELRVPDADKMLEEVL